MKRTVQPFSLRARFPLGTYTGHKPDGSSDLYPDVARLHSALIHAACTGTTAMPAPDREALAPTSSAMAALQWLEENPPTSLSLPEIKGQGGTDEFAYRKVSSINGNHLTEKRRIGDGTALSGPVSFIWENAPTDIAESISVLAEDVGCLGEGNSPVIIEVNAEEVAPTHIQAASQSLFSTSGERVRIPKSGRTEALLDNYLSSNPPRVPSMAADRSKKTELPLPPSVSTEGLGFMRYTPVSNQAGLESDHFIPWETVRVIPLSGGSIPPTDRVSWAVAAHRALIASIGENISSLITGKYANKSSQPANGLAIHCVPAECVAHLGIDKPALLIMIPTGAAPADLDQIDAAVSRTRRLWFPHRESRQLLHEEEQILQATRFWHEKPLGYERFWLTEPVMVPEIRSPKARRKGAAPWTLSQAAKLSVGFVWRELFGLQGRGETFYRQLVTTVEGHGVHVYQPKIVTSKNQDYVHKLPEVFTAQPYRAVFDLGDLVPTETTVTALGQTRHLSGGLLVPLDFPLSFAEAMREEAR